MALTEREIEGQLKECLRKGAEAAYALSQGVRGFAYLELMKEMKTAEACCRQMAHIRADTRWLSFGLKMAEAQQRCGDWLRAKEPSWRFKGLAEILASFLANLDQLMHKKTGRRGVILPRAGYQPEIYQSPVAAPANPKRSGLILPPGH